MAKPNSFPILFDEVSQLKISQLKKWGYLKPNQNISGLIEWSISNRVINTIGVEVNTYSDTPIIKLSYTYKKQKKQYIINCVTQLSNLGKGQLHYFICPITGKRSKQLYLIHGVLAHRNAFKGCFYESQLRSKRYREFERIYGGEFELERLYGLLYKKHFKRYYAGKPTKRYLKLMAEINRIEYSPVMSLD